MFQPEGEESGEQEGVNNSPIYLVLYDVPQQAGCGLNLARKPPIWGPEAEHVKEGVH